jgi:hypothetical protein
VLPSAGHGRLTCKLEGAHAFTARGCCRGGGGDFVCCDLCWHEGRKHDCCELKQAQGQGQGASPQDEGSHLLQEQQQQQQQQEQQQQQQQEQ